MYHKIHIFTGLWITMGFCTTCWWKFERATVQSV